MSRPDLITLTNELHARFTRATDGLDAAILEREPVAGDWTARDIAGHLDDWAKEMLEAAESYVAGSPVAHHPIADGEDFNQSHAAQHAGESWATAKSSLDATIARAAALMARLTPEQLEMHTILPWGGEGSLARLLRGIPGHNHEHIEELEAWRASRG